jgi:hypothetical protein
VNAQRQSARTAAGLGVLLIGMVPHPAAADADEPVRAAQRRTQPVVLQADLVPSIGDPAVHMALVRILEVQPAPSKAPAIEQGELSLRVLDVFHSTTLKNGDIIAVPFERYVDERARFKDPANQWNLLPLQPGQHLVLACRPLKPPRFWEGLAALAVSGPDAPEVAELRQCWQIARFQGPPEERQRRLEEAFASQKTPLTGIRGILRRYALHALSKQIIGPGHGVALINRAIVSDKTSPDEKMELASALTNKWAFDEGRGADANNREIVSILARELVKDTDPTRRSRYVNLLGNCLLRDFSEDADKDQQIRLALIRATGSPPSPKVAEILAEEAKTEEDAEDRKVTEELLEAWRAAAKNP